MSHVFVSSTANDSPPLNTVIFSSLSLARLNSGVVPVMSRFVQGKPISSGGCRGKKGFVFVLFIQMSGRSSAANVLLQCRTSKSNMKFSIFLDMQISLNVRVCFSTLS